MTKKKRVDSGRAQRIAHAAPEQVATFTVGPAYQRAMEKRRAVIRRVALGIAKLDPELAADLEQEAMIELWRLDVSRYDDDDAKYLTRALVNQMLTAWARERRQRLENRWTSVEGERSEEEIARADAGAELDGDEAMGRPSTEMLAMFDQVG